MAHEDYHAMFIVEYLLEYNLEAAQGRLDSFSPLSFRINATKVPPTTTTSEMQTLENTFNIPHDVPLTLMQYSVTLLIILVTLHAATPSIAIHRAVESEF
jgi:hypothetical protein